MGFGRCHYRRRRDLSPLSPAAAGALLAAVLLAGCVASGLRSEQYTVQRGDTLYSIAWRYQLDWRALARWNDIPPPYDIYPGEKLTLDRYSPAPPPRQNPAPAAPAPAPQPAKTAQKRPEPEKQAQVARRPPVSVRQQPPAAGHQWRWPSDGAILRDYQQSKPRHGIDIGGHAGDAIVAADGGRVVYSGAGLKGYGNLIIIKHDERYLSAYGFNRKLLVEQGEQVRRGQKIAVMGLGPGNDAMLHFEIRRDGAPVNPMRILPSR